VIGAAVSARLMAEYGREDSNFGTLSASSIRYIALLVVPMYVGLAALSSAAVRLFYGVSYLPAIPVLQISLILAVPKAFYWFPSAALQAADRQGVMFRWMLVMAALNLGLDALLIPPYGAVGAALGNGIAQPVAVVVLSIVTARICNVRMPWASLGGTVAMSLAMGAVVYLATRALHPAAALLCGPVLGFFVYLALLRVTGTFRAADLAFVRQFESRVPARLRGACGALLEWLTVAQPVPVGELALVTAEAEVKNVCAGQGQ
jgi:O-antigen/teichoic acid export membrane protein